jgi:hypothetical protein
VIDGKLSEFEAFWANRPPAALGVGGPA